MIKKRIPKYKQHERMGQGDPIRMAGLPMQPKKKGKLSKTKRNKKRYDRMKENYEYTGDRYFDFEESRRLGDV